MRSPIQLPICGYGVPGTQLNIALRLKCRPAYLVPSGSFEIQAKPQNAKQLCTNRDPSCIPKGPRQAMVTSQTTVYRTLLHPPGSYKWAFLGAQPAHYLGSSYLSMYTRTCIYIHMYTYIHTYRHTYIHNLRKPIKHTITIYISAYVHI